MLILLLATCETALERFGTPEPQVRASLLTDLERVIDGARTELEALDG
jgi:hypothetical protein